MVRMKYLEMKTVIVTLLFIMVAGTANGQWYTDRYGAASIDFLTPGQLQESLADRNNKLLYSGVVIVVGGAMAGSGYLVRRNGFSDDPSFLAELMGPQLSGNLLMIGGGIVALGGIVWTIDNLFIKSQIKSAQQRYYGSTIELSPVLIGDHSGRLKPGLGVKVIF